MALVSYDYDSGSENDEDNEAEASACVVIPPTVKNVQANGVDSIDDEPHSSLFSKLPDTKAAATQIVEDKIEDFVPKSAPPKERQKVKITIPSLSQFVDDDDDEPETKRLKSSAKGSSLLSLLPPVKGSIMTSKSFVPNSVAQKNKALQGNKAIQKPSTTTSLVPHAVRKKAEVKKQAVIRKISTKIKDATGSDVDTDDDMDLPETYDDAMWEKVCGRPKPKEIIYEPEVAPQMEIINIAPEAQKPYDGLDNTAFKELLGTLKKPLGNIKLIDINEEEILPEKDIWMTKALTDPEMEHKKEEEEEVDPTRRKKHHITYLAQQAKANEQDLKNQWSASKNNRLQTRAKYGF